MEKVKVTKKQADWLERYDLTQEQMDHYIDIQPYKKRPDSPIVDWSASKLARALYIGYEVEPEYPQEADWVKYDTGSAIIYGQIDTVAFDGVIGNFSNGQRQRFHKSSVSFMTPSEIKQEKERIFFAEHGREPWELRKGDILHDESNGDTISVLKVEMNDDTTAVFYEDDYMYLSDVKEYYKIACFSESRLDVKTNE